MTEQELNKASELLASKKKAEEILGLDLDFLSGRPEKSRAVFSFNRTVVLDERLNRVIHNAVKEELKLINKEIEEL